MSQRISEPRKLAYYIGGVMMLAGFLLFASTFVTFLANFGEFGSGVEKAMKSGAIRAFGGMGLIFIGGVVRGIGAAGAAGSGLILNPKQAREDLEPFSRMAGGMVKDALDEADISLGQRPAEQAEPASPAEPIVMIKCRACGRLNEEDSKFCQECGQAL